MPTNDTTATLISLDELERDPHAVLARLRAEVPVAWVPALGAWLVTRRDLALEAMRAPERFTVDDERFSTGRVVGRSMLTTEGEEHDRHRAPFARRFRLREVRDDLGPFVAAETARLIDSFATRGHADLSAELAAPLAASVVCHVLGVPDERALDWYAAIVHATTELTRGADEVTPEARKAVEELRAAAGEQEVADVATLLFGGIETTEGMIANALLHLLENPAQLELARQDESMTAAAVEESLRLEPAAATIDRYATRDLEFGGAQIAKGDLVTISIAAANRDPDSFTDPNNFDVRRPNAKQHLAFAHGPHVCIGMHLARLEAHTAINRVLTRLPGLRLAPPVERPRGLVFRKPRVLRVTWQA
jgi:cytochrome P450